MLGAGTVINPIIKIVTTVAILGAVYLFIVKPALDTTESISNSVNDSVSNSLESAFGETDGLSGLSQQIQGNIDEALAATGSSDRLQKCISRALDGASTDADRVQRCVERFSP
jgi:hypothetical protein